MFNNVYEDKMILVTGHTGFKGSWLVTWLLKLNAKVVLNDDKPVNIGHLISLIYNAKYIISNDTGPAHACTHLKKKRTCFIWKSYLT